MQRLDKGERWKGGGEGRGAHGNTYMPPSKIIDLSTPTMPGPSDGDTHKRVSRGQPPIHKDETRAGATIALALAMISDFPWASATSSVL